MQRHEEAGIVAAVDTYDRQIEALKLARQRRHQAAKLRASGKTLQEIADALGVSSQRVSQYLGRTGVYMMRKKRAA